MRIKISRSPDSIRLGTWSRPRAKSFFDGMPFFILFFFGFKIELWDLKDIVFKERYEAMKARHKLQGDEK